MASFKDKNTHEWLVELDGPKIHQVRLAHKLDLAALDGTAYEKMADDPVLLVDVLWILCRAQANAKNITDVQFGEALVGDAIERATEAMLSAIADFFPSRKREMLLTLARKNAKTREIGMEKAMAALNDPTIQTNLEMAMDRQIAEKLQSLLTLSSGATNTPATAESALTGSP